MVRPIILSSILVDRVSETRIRVPSERTTFSSGVIKKANGRLFVSNDTVRFSAGAWDMSMVSGSQHLRQAFDDYECHIGLRGNSAFNALLVVLG
jgi:hypothetical protein